MKPPKSPRRASREQERATPALHWARPDPLRLILPYETPSQNEWDAMAWQERERWKANTRQWLRSSIARIGSREAGSLAIGRETRFMRVVVSRFGFHRITDHGNFVGGCKGLLDSLVRVGLLAGDRDDQIAETYATNVVDRKRRRTEIVLIPNGQEFRSYFLQPDAVPYLAGKGWPV